MHTSRVFPFSRALVVLACLGLVAPAATAHDDDDDDDDHERLTASAVFGRGLNTAQRGNVVNHAVLPKKIRIKAGGVVDFAVAGFHDIVVFKPGFRLKDLIDAGGGSLPQMEGFFVLPPDPSVPLPPQFEFLEEKIHYRGILPAGAPTPAGGSTPEQGDPANGSNRAEPVAFLEKGTYLVICNVRPHLLDGMLARVKVE